MLCLKVAEDPANIEIQLAATQRGLARFIAGPTIMLATGTTISDIESDPTPKKGRARSWHHQNRHNMHDITTEIDRTRNNEHHPRNNAAGDQAPPSELTQIDKQDLKVYFGPRISEYTTDKLISGKHRDLEKAESGNEELRVMLRLRPALDICEDELTKFLATIGLKYIGTLAPHNYDPEARLIMTETMGSALDVMRVGGPFHSMPRCTSWSIKSQKATLVKNGMKKAAEVTVVNLLKWKGINKWSEAGIAMRVVVPRPTMGVKYPQHQFDMCVMFRGLDANRTITQLIMEYIDEIEEKVRNEGKLRYFDINMQAVETAGQAVENNISSFRGDDEGGNNTIFRPLRLPGMRILRINATGALQRIVVQMFSVQGWSFYFRP